MSAPVDCEPLRGWLPDQAPEATHEVALVEDQLRFEALPLVMVLGLALKLTIAVGFGLTEIVADCDAEPPTPVQVSV